MPAIDLPAALLDRLAAIARRQGKTAQDCAEAAILSFVEDHEQALRLAAPFGGDGTWRPPEDFYE